MASLKRQRTSTSSSEGFNLSAKRSSSSMISTGSDSFRYDQPSTLYELPTTTRTLRERATTSTDDSGRHAHVRQSKPIPDFLIMKTSGNYNAMFGNGIVGVQQISPIEECMVCKVSNACAPEDFFLPHLLDNVEKGSHFKQLAPLLQDYLGDLKWKDFSKNEGADPEKTDPEKKKPGLWYSVNGSNRRSRDDPDDMGPPKPYHDLRGKGFVLRRGYMMGMCNAFGRNVLQIMLNLCVQVVIADLDEKVGVARDLDESRDSLEQIIVTNTDYSNGSIRYRFLDDRHSDCVSDRDTVQYLDAGLARAKAARYASSSKTTPDVTILQTNDGDDEPWKCLLTGEVDADDIHKARGSRSAQTWLQALVGLKELDVSYGVLFDTRNIVLYQLKKEEVRRSKFKTNVRYLHTRTYMWDLIKDDNMFDVEELLQFMKTVIGIISEFSMPKSH